MPGQIEVKNLTWQQVVICCALLVAVVGAYKLFGELPAGVLLVLSSITNLLLGRAGNTDKDPAK
jgi:Na+/H+ antiporter NhaC